MVSGNMQERTGLAGAEFLNYSIPNEDVVLRSFTQKYEILNVLGTGISGVVRQCMERGTGKCFAVKIIELSDNEEGVNLKNSTLREIEILQNVSKHPYIVELHETFIGSTHILLIFELCKNELFELLTEVVSFSEARTRQIMKQLLKAVSYLHKNKIVHRDIKAENILISKDNNIKLSDFGFASFIDHENQFKDLCGTFEYLSPEIIKSQLYEGNHGYGSLVDMWACGALMFTLLSGNSPFWAKDKSQFLRNILEGKLCFHDDRWNDCSLGAKDLISKLLEVDPRVRLTAEESLKHSFFNDEEVRLTSKKDRNKEFIKKPRFRLKAAILAVQASVFFLRLAPKTNIPLFQISTDPYTSKPFRKLMDIAAFRVYGHWVGRVTSQNRELMFQSIFNL